MLFSFTSDDTQAVKNYLFPHTSDRQQRLTVGSGMNPSRQWALKNELAEGSIHRCIRKEITQGTCTPVLFDFSGIDFSDWQTSCF